MTCLQSQTLEFKLQLQFYNKLVKNKKNSDNKSSIMDHTHKEASHRTFIQFVHVMISANNLGNIK